tara:strand:- start:1970 stop:2392 length:423 start_codon:yes stop_codon:yes gene_type:complete
MTTLDLSHVFKQFIGKKPKNVFEDYVNKPKSSLFLSKSLINKKAEPKKKTTIKEIYKEVEINNFNDQFDDNLSSEEYELIRRYELYNNCNILYQILLGQIDYKTLKNIRDDLEFEDSIDQYIQDIVDEVTNEESDNYIEA